MQISKAVESHHKSIGETVSVLFAVGMRGLADKPGHLVALVY